MRARYARQIRRGIVLARRVREYTEGIRLNPRTYPAMLLVVAISRTSEEARSVPLTSRAYDRAMATLRYEPEESEPTS